MRVHPYNAYIAWTFAFTAGVLLAVAAWAWVVDPYSVHGRERVQGFNAKKPFIYTHSREAKRALAARARPRTLFLGNSRMDGGMDPLSDTLPHDLRPAFNFALPGQGLAGDHANLVRTPGLERVRRVVLGLDFVDFPFNPAVTSPDPAEPMVEPDFDTPFLTGLVETSLSLDAIGHSVMTVVRQSGPYTNSMTVLGGNTFAAFEGIVRLEGHHALFNQRNVENARIYLRKPTRLPGPDWKRAPSFVWLEWVMAWSKARSVQVDLVIYPYHAHILELFHLTDLWPVFEDWKRYLVAHIGRLREPGSADAATIRLWDFSGYSAVATEPVPPPGDTRTRMRWYWEAGHFKSELGDLMLARINGQTPRPSLGVRLDAENVERVLAGITDKRKEWQRRDPQAVEYLRELYQAVRSSRR